MKTKKKEKNIRVRGFRRGLSFVNPFNRKQKITIEDESAKNKKQAKLALGAVAAVYSVGAIYSARKALPQVGNIAEGFRKKAYVNAARKTLPAPKIGEGVYATVQNISETQVGKVYKPFSQSTKVTILKNGEMREEANKLYSKPISQIIRGRDKEFGLLKELQNTGVVPKIGSKGRFGYTMEKIEGDTLYDLIHSKIQNPSDEQLVSIGKEVGTALKKVHNKGILHGDLHANNILIDKKGKAKIIDLGLGRKSSYKPSEPGFLTEAIQDTTRLVSGGFSSNKKWREKFSEGFYEAYKFSFEPYRTIEFKAGSALTKVSGHMRDGKWIQSFRAARRVAKNKTVQGVAKNKAVDIAVDQLPKNIGTAVNAGRFVADPTTQKAATALTKFDGQLPSRKEALTVVGKPIISALKNPAKLIRDGFEREAVAMSAYKQITGKNISKGALIEQGLQRAKDDLNKLATDPIGTSKTILQVTGRTAKSAEAFAMGPAKELTVATGGVVGSTIGGTLAGPGGAVAGDLIGARVVRRGIEDVDAWRAAYQQFSGLPEFNNQNRLQQFNVIRQEAVKTRTKKLGESTKIDLAGDVAGWAAGNAGAAIIPVPFAGLPFGMYAAITAQKTQALVQQGVKPPEAAYKAFLDSTIKKGNAREARMRATIREKWNRIRYTEGLANE